MSGGWRDSALCAQTDPALFFPETKGNDTLKALRICRRCQVVDVCLTDQLTWEAEQNDQKPYGVAGGMTANARHRILKENS